MSTIKALGIPKIKALGLRNEGTEDKKELIGGTNIQNLVCTCKIHTKAKNIKELIALVKDAEALMIKNKMTDVGDRINCLRGIYYGTTWSMDYQKEKSSMRNKVFLLMLEM